MGSLPGQSCSPASRRLVKVSRGPTLRLLAVTALTLVPLGTVYLPVGVAGSLLAVVIGVLAVRAEDWPATRVAAMAALLALIGSTGVPFAIWVVVGVMWLASRKVPEMMPASGWLPGGAGRPAAWWLSGLTVAAAGAALVLWATWTDEFSGATTDTVDAVRDLPLVFIVAAVAGFVTLNAISEEVAYRSIAYETAASMFSPAGAVIAQAVAFGALHIVGFPAGPVGVGLAFMYGLALGTLRHLTAGLRFPVIVHMAADTTIAILALTLIPG